jgi:putative protease
MELVAPVGDWAMVRAAEKAGADAIYFGLKEWSMRHSAKNFTLKDLEEISKLKVKKYLCLNTLMFDKDLKQIENIIKKIKGKVDAVVCWDMGVISLLNKYKIPIHLSTQASVANSEALKMYKKLGVKRIVLARELNLEDIKNIKKSGMKIEVFVHGAMCMAISGRCFLSQDMYGMSANRGRCVQSCRREYDVIDRQTNKKLKLGSNYILSPKDLCALSFMEKLKKLKIDAFKIEGRSKNPEYVKTVVECYREAIDNKLSEKRIKELVKKLKTVYNRDFSEGFYFGAPGNNDWSNEGGNKAIERKKFIGKVNNYFVKSGVADVDILSGSLKVGDEILIIGNKTGILRQEVKSMHLDFKFINNVKKGSNIGLKVKERVRKNDQIYLIYSKV